MKRSSISGLSLLATLALGFPTYAETPTADPNTKASPEASPSTEVKKEEVKIPKKIIYVDQCVSDEGILLDIQKQRAELTQRLKSLEAREQELKDREAAIEDKIKEISKIRDDIDKTNQSRKLENDNKVAKMVETIEIMNPKPAVAMLVNLDETLAVTVLSRLSNEKLSKLFALMAPEKSSRLSELYTGYIKKNETKGGEKNESKPNDQSKSDPGKNGKTSDQQSSSIGDVKNIAQIDWR